MRSARERVRYGDGPTGGQRRRGWRPTNPRHLSAKRAAPRAPGGSPMTLTLPRVANAPARGLMVASSNAAR